MISPEQQVEFKSRFGQQKIVNLFGRWYIYHQASEQQLLVGFRFLLHA